MFGNYIYEHGVIKVLPITNNKQTMSTTTKTTETSNYKLHSLMAHLPKMSEEQINTLHLIASGHIMKRDMMDVVFGEQVHNVDSAYPQSYQDELIPIIGGHNCPNFVFDYNGMVFGKLVNLDREFLSRLHKIFK